MACERPPIRIDGVKALHRVEDDIRGQVESAQAAMPKPNHAPPREPVPKLSWASLVSTASKLA